MNIKYIISVIIVTIIHVGLAYCDRELSGMVDRIAPETIEEYIGQFKHNGDIKYYEYSSLYYWLQNQRGQYLHPNIDSLIENTQALPSKPDNKMYMKVWFENGKTKFIQEISAIDDVYGNSGFFYVFLGDTIEICACNEKDKLYTFSSQIGVDLWVSIYKGGKLVEYLTCCTYPCSMNSNGSDYKYFKIYSITTYDYYPDTDKVKAIKEFYNYSDMETDKWYFKAEYNKTGDCTFLEDNGPFSEMNRGKKNKYNLSK